MLNSVRAVIGSRSHRRELRAYTRFVFSRGRVHAAVSAAIGGGLRRGAAPAGFQRPVAAALTPDGAPGPRVLPVRVRRERHPVESIPLATRSWSMSDGPPWSFTFADPEDTFAAHRFEWVQPLLERGADARIIGNLALEWLKSNPAGLSETGWDSYSVAERLVNWLYVTGALADSGDPDSHRISHRLVAALEAHAAVLHANLELRGDATNNHLINDARALYLAGTALRMERALKDAREIVRFGARTMFVDGFLREASTHYHLLLCRTYVELYAAAVGAGDRAFAEELKPAVAAMCRAAQFLTETGEPGLIGDISPDFAPAFHGHVGQAGRALLGEVAPPGGDGWHNLLLPAGSKVDVSPLHSPRVVAYREAGYYRVRHGRWSVFAYVNPFGYVPAWSHGHADIGSFVADLDGAPLLVDSGRSTYMATPLGAYGRSVRSHNAISIDGYEPGVTHGLNGFDGVLAQEYCRRPPSIDIVHDNHGVQLRVAHYGFTRIDEGLSVVRTVSLTPQTLTVEDRIGGAGRRRIEVFLHFHPAMSVEAVSSARLRCIRPSGGEVVVDAPAGCSLSLTRGAGQTSSRPSGWYSSRYGVAEPCWTATFTVMASLPATLSCCATVA